MHRAGNVVLVAASLLGLGGTAGRLHRVASVGIAADVAGIAGPAAVNTAGRIGVGKLLLSVSRHGLNSFRLQM
jgi:hypothetical protein